MTKRALRAVRRIAKNKINRPCRSVGTIHSSAIDQEGWKIPEFENFVGFGYGFAT